MSLAPPLLVTVKWTVVGRMVWAWTLTLPATALLGYLLVRSFSWGN